MEEEPKTEVNKEIEERKQEDQKEEIIKIQKEEIQESKKEKPQDSKEEIQEEEKKRKPSQKENIKKDEKEDKNEQKENNTRENEQQVKKDDRLAEEVTKIEPKNEEENKKNSEGQSPKDASNGKDRFLNRKDSLKKSFRKSFVMKALSIQPEPIDFEGTKVFGLKQKIVYKKDGKIIKKEKLDRMLMLGDSGIKILDSQEKEIYFFKWSEIKKFKSSLTLGEWTFEANHPEDGTLTEFIFKTLQVRQINEARDFYLNSILESNKRSSAPALIEMNTKPRSKSTNPKVMESSSSTRRRGFTDFFRRSSVEPDSS